MNQINLNWDSFATGSRLLGNITITNTAQDDTPPALWKSFKVDVYLFENNEPFLEESSINGVYSTQDMLDVNKLKLLARTIKEAAAQVNTYQLTDFEKNADGNVFAFWHERSKAAFAAANAVFNSWEQRLAHEYTDSVAWAKGWV